MRKTMLLAMALLMPALLAGPATGPGGREKSNPVGDLVRRLELGKPVGHGGLTIIPVYLDKVRERASYATLDEALQNGWVTITEVESGRVPQVRISNTSKRIIFLMGGEILTGCRQDRILASDILLAPGTKDLLAPVYCVEQGRWSHTSDRFYSKENLGTPALRAKAQEKSGAAQSEIWERITEQNRVMGVPSATDAYQDVYEKKETVSEIRRIEEKMKGIPRLQEDAVGVVIGVGGRVVSADIFADPDLFSKQWLKILKSSALASIGSTKGMGLDRSEAAAFLKSFLGRSYQRRQGLDLGFEYSSSGSGASIQALVYSEGVVHLSGFPQEKDRVKVVRDSGMNAESAKGAGSQPR